MSGITRGSRLEGKEGAPSYPWGANPLSPGIGGPGQFTFLIKGVLSDNQPPSCNQEEGTLRTPCALAPPTLTLNGHHSLSLHSLTIPHSSSNLGPQLSKSRLTLAQRRDGPTLRLSLCTDLAHAPPAWPSGSPGGAHSQGNLLPGFPAARTPPRGPSWGGPELPSPFLPPPPGPTHRCPRKAPGLQAARRRSPRGDRWGPAPRCTGSRRL